MENPSPIVRPSASDDTHAAPDADILNSAADVTGGAVAVADVSSRRREQPELATVKFLREHGLEALVAKFHLSTYRHAKHPSIVLLKYSQVESPFNETVVQECRGLILDESDNWRVVCYPFTKFFNYGEHQAANLDWDSTVRVMDKVDGSLMSVYYYKGEWHVASSGVPDARGYVYRSKRTDTYRQTCAQLFWQIWKQEGYPMPTNTSHCYMFELFSATNRIIVLPTEERIFHTGARDLNTLQEIDPVETAKENGWRTPKIFEYSSLDEVVEAARSLDPHAREGFVVCDRNFNRVKVKSPRYIALAHLTRLDHEGSNVRRMLDIVRMNEGSEFLAYFPQWAELYQAVRERYNKLCEEAEAAWEAMKQYENDHKEFSRQAGKQRLNDYIWARKKGRTASAREWFSKVPDKKLLRLLPDMKGIKNTKAVYPEEIAAAVAGAEKAKEPEVEAPDEKEEDKKQEAEEGAQ